MHNLMVAVLLLALAGSYPLDLASLYFTYVQALIAIHTCFDLEEDKVMANMFKVVGGAHGVA